MPIPVAKLSTCKARVHTLRNRAHVLFRRKFDTITIYFFPQQVASCLSSVARLDSFGLESYHPVSLGFVLGLCAEFLEHLDEGPLADSAVAKLAEHPLEVFGVDEVV